MMEALRVNGDYEIELFHGNHGPRIMNESLEFLAFFLSRSPVLTTKKYAPDYLDYVENVTGHRPVLRQEGPFTNWWGPLKDLEHERWMNSKLTSAELAVENGWSPGTHLLQHAGQTENIELQDKFLLKDPHEMSGRGIRTIDRIEELKEHKKFPCILEPLLPRKFDFSNYVYPDGKVIAYENLVDHKFQYKGTLFRNHTNPVLAEIGFWSKTNGDDREKFDHALEKIRKHFSQHPLHTGFSVDSFVYGESEKLKIHPLCEVNYRRTLGSTAYELAGLYGRGGPWSLFVLARSGSLEFKSLWSKLEHLEHVLILSPPDVRYQMFLLSAPSHIEGKKLFSVLKRLLPEAQFSVNIEN